MLRPVLVAASVLSACATAASCSPWGGLAHAALGRVLSEAAGRPARSILTESLQLSRRLHFQGPAILGNQPGGSGGPWAVWLAPNNLRRSYLGTGDRALFSGPGGAHSEFHYFDSTALSKDGEDAYRGEPITGARAIRAAEIWLRATRVPIPRGTPHLELGIHSTDIGGTGECCFSSLAALLWGPSSRYDQDTLLDLYVADAGVVVQADAKAPAAAGAETPAHPCKGDHADSNDVILGPRCFSYAVAARGVIFSEIGFHDGWIHDPRMVAGLPLNRVLGRARSLRCISSAPDRVACRLVLGAAVYRVVVIRAFPGLAGSTWETVHVYRSGNTQAAPLR